MLGKGVFSAEKCSIMLPTDPTIQAVAGTGDLPQKVDCLIELRGEFKVAAEAGRLNVQLTPEGNPLQLYFFIDAFDQGIITVREAADQRGVFHYLIQIHR